jgi:thiamine-phosphate pyrophosphorylase
MTMTLRKRLRLCVIPDRILGAPRSLEEQALCALRGGATAIQLRDKNASTRELYETAVTLKRLCDDCGALLIVNDRIDVALAAGADGVHLGQSDLPVPEARRLAPPGFLVGATAHSVEEALQAEQDGADYLGIGAAFPTASKTVTTLLGPEGIRHVTSRISLPAIAIGGITPDRVRCVLDAGVCGVAVIAAVVASAEPEKATREFAAHIP